MRFQVILILACIYAVTANEQEELVDHISSVFELTKEQVRICTSRTRITLDDLDTFPHSLDDVGKKPENEESERRSICFLACVAQERGLMIGTKLQITKIHDDINHRIGDDKRKSLMHAAADLCVDVGNNMTDECVVALEFIKCMDKKVKKEIVAA